MGERYPDTVEVVGSNPIVPTRKQQRVIAEAITLLCISLPIAEKRLFPTVSGQRLQENRVLIRDFADNDWPQVAIIYDLSKPDELKGIVPPDAIIPIAQDGKRLRYFFESHILVYEEEGKVLGFVGQKENVVSWFFVHPDHRRKGIGQSLMHQLIDIWKDPLELNVAKQNHVAISLYSRVGFKVYYEFSGNMFGTPISVVRMRLSRKTKDLQSSSAPNIPDGSDFGELLFKA